jgi:hypothetical protein
MSFVRFRSALIPAESAPVFGTRSGPKVMNFAELDSDDAGFDLGFDLQGLTILVCIRHAFLHSFL